MPPILMIQLKRFEYNFEENKNVKILSSLEYEEELDFGRWTTSGEKDVYELYAVMVHEGARA
jgi:ubiquitin carboxyl-terminal hydrolase 7